MLKNKTVPKEKLNIFILIECLICAGVVFFTCIKINSNITSLIFTFSFILLLGFSAKYFISSKEYTNLDLLMIVIILVSVINIMLNCLITNNRLNFESIKPFFIYISTIIFFRFTLDIKVNKRTCNYIFIIQMIIAFMYVYAYKFVPQSAEGLQFDALSLNFSNPNLAGMFLLQSLLYMSVAVFYFKNFLLKILSAVLAVTLYGYILETAARNAIISFWLFVIVSLIYMLLKDKKPSKFVTFLINISPIVFVPIYLTYVEKIQENGILSFLISEGKNLESRVDIWRFAFERLGNYWLIGNYGKCNSNLHNSHVVLLTGYGVIVLVLVIIFNCIISNKVSDGVNTTFKKLCLCAFFAVIFMGLGEGALYSGGVGIYIFCGIFLILANSDFAKSDIKNKENSE